MIKKKSDIDYSSIETIVANKVVIRGDIRAEGSMRIDGAVEGRVELSGDLIIGEKGKVKGQMSLGNVLVAGKVIGDIKAQGKVKVTATGTIYGDVESETFVLEEGGKFQGTCKMASAATEDKGLKKGHSLSTYTPPGCDTKNM
ncbi:MAG: bactofilin family protein [Ignavibacteriales bacterium]